MNVLPLGNRLVPKSIRTLIIWALLILACTFTNGLAQTSKLYSSDLQISIYILYFDQSSHQLRPRVKTTLDSLARLLIGQPKLMVIVTGYTDNVGKQELNMALAENRAKTVDKYLQQQGVSADQIQSSWLGPDRTVSANSPEAKKTISRRVIVQLLPK